MTSTSRASCFAQDDRDATISQFDGRLSCPSGWLGRLLSRRRPGYRRGPSRTPHRRRHCGFGLWAVEVSGGSPFIGFVGLHRVPFEAPFTPAVEIGWRIARGHWGHGYATQAATEAVRYGLEQVGLDEIVSFTTPDNVRSWKVMERLGMIRDPTSDFEHPNVPIGHRLRSHVLYRFPWSPERVDPRSSGSGRTPGGRHPTVSS